LKDVPWDQALDVVMRTRGLVARHSGNVLLVSTPAEVTGSQLEAATRTAQDDLEPLVSQTFVVSYQKTGDVVALLGAKDAKLLSSRGAMLSDERTGQIFVQDTPSRLERIGAIIRSMDKPVRQVMIEAKIILADLSVSKQLGVRMQGAALPSDAVDAASVILGNKGFVDTGSTAATNFAYTKFNRDATRLVNIQLQALETDNRIRTVSNPRVITSNKQAAVIEQGSEIPYQVATSSGATSTEFKKATLSLKVTPQIAPDGTILLDVEVTKDSVGVATPNGPAIDTRRVQTKILINDGGTVVLGGVFEEDDNRTIDKIPGLADMPLIGHLFKALDERKRRTELLVFLTPVVLQDS
jgi:type IV pilus assembly protein PilQ